jgi:hypothetical protein
MLTFFDNVEEEQEFLSFLKRGMTYSGAYGNHAGSGILELLSKDPKVSIRLKDLINKHRKESSIDWHGFWTDEYFPPICASVEEAGFYHSQLLALAGFESKLSI